MFNPQTLLIRADAGGTLGTGHVMRMIALAQAWQDRGGEVALAACQCPPALVSRLIEEGIHFISLGDQPLGGEADCAETIRVAKSLKSKWVVLDGYHFGEDFQIQLKQNDFKVLAIDDFGQCDEWHTDLILNQNVYGAEFVYPKLDPRTDVLRGPRYALLRREFQENHKTPASLPTILGPLQKLLLTFGGVDPDNVTGTILSALNALDRHRLSIRVIIGAGNINGESLDLLAAQSPHEIEFVRDVMDMPAQYRWADGVIGAGGSTCLEWLLFGLPAALVCLADNQRLVVSALSGKARCLDLGAHTDLRPDILAKQLSAWIQKAGEITSFESFQVDASGASRVAAKMDNGLRLRSATNLDCEQYFTWANDATVRQNAINTQIIQWADHVEWFSSRLNSGKVRFFVCLDAQEKPVGQVRFEQKSPPKWEIDYSVEPALRGQGVGFHMMSLALAAFRKQTADPVLAVVRESNKASSRIFEKLGFLCEHGATLELQYYRG